MIVSLPSLSNTVGNNMVRHIRAAVPADVRFVWSSSGISVDSVNYYGSLVFENGQLSKGLFDGGYATFSGGQPTFHYYTKDHLGNNRAVVNHDGTLEQTVHYYPFGATYYDTGRNINLQRYTYNGKELDCMHGLNFYDYSARQYDPLLCRFL